MNPSRLFIERPVATTLLMVAMVVFGMAAYFTLPVSDLPNVDFPTIQVNASLSGASPETMASSVATPLERQFSTIAGVDSMSSTNTQGSTSITIQFNLDRDIDAAAQDVQSAIAKAQRLLPQGMPNPPSFQKVNPADSPVLFLSLTSPIVPLSTVHEYADTVIAQRLSTISGVAQVSIFGGQKYAVRIYADPEKLAARQIGIDEVVQAIQRNNVNLPTGILYGATQSFTVKATGQLMNADAFRPLIVAWRNGAPVRLEDIARVVDSVENDKGAAWTNGTRSISMSVQRQPGTNTVAVVDAIMDVLPSLREQLPAGVDLQVRFDRSQPIRESVHDVKFTLVLTVFLVIAVIFIFLRNVRATLIPALAVPISLIGTFGVMYMMNFSLDNLSLMALTLAVGFVVDDAIVMLENIVRHIEAGESPQEAALNGSGEIAFTIISMTISLAAVFIPVLFMQGIVGRLLHEFAVVISVAILLSGVVSLTLTPMLCSLFLKPHQPGRRHNFLYRAIEWFFDLWLAGYRWTLWLTMKLKFLALVASIALLVYTVHLFQVAPKGFIPNEDIGTISGPTEGNQGISFEAMVEAQKQAAAVIEAHPAVATVLSNVGNGSGRFFVRLKDRADREQSAQQVINELRPRLAAIPGIQVFLSVPPPIRIGGMSSKSQYQFTLQSPDTAELFAAATRFEGLLRRMPELQDVSTDLQIRNPEVNVVIDRDRAAALGVTPEQIEQALFSAYGSRQISSIYAPNNQYQVIFQLDAPFQTDPFSLRQLRIRSSDDRLVPLESVARLENAVGPLSINHLGQSTAVTLSFNLREGISLGEGVSKVEQLARRELPASIGTSFQGTAQVFQRSVGGLAVLLLMAVLVIYLVLGILYESFIHPLTILSGLPSAGLGALLTLQLFNKDLNLYAFVGVIMLVGIVKKNAIMMIDFALDAQRSEGRKPEEAIVEGCLVRFRPIMMTTAAALMGTAPIALGHGAGAESRQPLGLAVVGGLVVSQILTLYITPVYYVYFEKIAGLFRRRPVEHPLPVPTGEERAPFSAPAVGAERS